MANEIKYIKGTSQENRFPEALHNDYFKIDEREFDDLVVQSAEFSKFLKYYTVNENNEGKDDDWQDFFKSVQNENGLLNTDKIKKMEDEGDMQPHLALLFAFFKLFKREQDNLNTLTQRHLDYYYKDILGFKRATGCAGKVPVFFELNKNAKSALVSKGTILMAGNDENGKAIKYKSAEDIVVNQTVVADFYADNSDSESTTVNNSNNTVIKKDSERKDCGFALTSPIFKRVDGSLTFETSINKLEQTFNVEYTSATGWKTAKLNGNKITIEDNKAQYIAPYNKKLHDKYGVFDTTDPVLVFTIKENVDIPDIKKINEIQLEVNGSTELLISNSEGIKENKIGADIFGINCDKKAYCKIIPTDLQKKQGIYEFKDIKLETNTGSPFLRNDRFILSEECGLSKYLAQTNKYHEDVQKILKEEDTESQPAKINNITSEIPTLNIPTLTKAITAKFTVNDKNVKCFAFAKQKVTSIKSKKTLDEEIKEFLKLHTTKKSGYLYVGLEKVLGDTVVNLFFRLEEYKEVNSKTNMNWEYLCGDTWEEYKKGDTIVKDTTSDFQKSGIIGFKISEESLQPHTVMPEDKMWIRMKYSEDKFPKVIDIKAQAVEAEYDETSEGRPSIGESLAKETIKKLSTSIVGIKKVVQPYPGFEGEYEEDEKHFYSRVSERLRHKGRAVTTWDYERLVLQNFPSIAEVVCLNCSDTNGKYAPGNVTLIVLPDLSRTKQENSLKPKVESIVINKIEAFINNVKSPFVTVKAINAKYSEVKVDCELSLKKGYDDDAYYTKTINEQLRDYIAPWYNKEKTITRNDNHNVSKILYFLENLPYVDHIKKLDVIVGGRKVDSSGDFGPSSQLEILTSVPTHAIKIIKDEQ